MFTKKDALYFIKKKFTNEHGFCPKMKDVRFVGSDDAKMVVDINNVRYVVRYEVVVERADNNLNVEDNPA